LSVRQTLIDSRFSTAICAPIYSAYDGLSTQVAIRFLRDCNTRAVSTAMH
jgi:hypothetical protein